MVETRTVLVIDDSSTIRRLVDSVLSREGYSVILAPNAEDGLSFAVEHRPDMILLDHQLPGTTGYDVCQKLAANSDLCQIPVVISSTLRKKAYIEYADLANVVDMLPKPYAEELLLTTVSNALETGALVVESQSQGTAVPEIIDEQSDSDLAGTMVGFSIREVLDFLNNSKKNGTLQVEGPNRRYSISLANGRVVGISATGVAADEVQSRLPTSLEELAPVLNVTMGRGGSALESIVDLLNTEVLDPRLLRKLLRHQAAVLLTVCFADELKAFQFVGQKAPPLLFERLPLDISVLALLVEGSQTLPDEELPSVSPETIFSRQPIRGQNLDRAGLSAKQSQVLGQLATAKSLSQLADATGADMEAVRRVLYGLQLADLVACEDPERSAVHEVVVFESDLELANKLNKAFTSSERYKLTVVNDATAARLLSQRTAPRVLVADASDESLFQTLRSAVTSSTTAWIATTTPGSRIQNADANLERPYSATALLDALDDVTGGATYQQSQVTTPDATSERNLCTT